MAGNPAIVSPLAYVTVHVRVFFGSSRVRIKFVHAYRHATHTGRSPAPNLQVDTIFPFPGASLSGASEALSSGLPSKKVKPASSCGSPSDVADHPGTGPASCSFTASRSGHRTKSAAEPADTAKPSAIGIQSSRIVPPRRIIVRPFPVPVKAAPTLISIGMISR